MCFPEMLLVCKLFKWTDQGRSLQERLGIKNSRYSNVKGALVFTGILTVGFSSYRILTYTPVVEGQSNIRNKNFFITEPSGNLNRTMLQSLARGGANLVLIDHNPVECEKTRSQLIKATSINPSKVDCHIFDWKSLSSVYHMTQKIFTNYKSYDRLVLTPPMISSSVVASKLRINGDGFEENNAVNYFAPYVIMDEFLKKMKKNDRIVVSVDTNSALLGHDKLDVDKKNRKSIPLDNLNWLEGFETNSVYDRLNAFLYYIANHFADKGREKGVEVLIADPKLTDVTGVFPNYMVKYMGASYISYILTKLIPRKSSYTSSLCAQIDSTSFKAFPEGATPFQSSQVKETPIIYEKFAQHVLDDVSRKWTDSRKKIKINNSANS